MMYVVLPLWKSFFSPIRASYFIMYALFMKIFNLACWDKSMAVRLISVFWAQKRLIPTF